MAFDANSFLSSVINGANDIKVTPVPKGEYMGVIEKCTAAQWQSRDGTKSGIRLDVYWIVEDQEVRDFLHRDTVIVKQGIMLDLTPDGRPDNASGTNIQLGRLREAVGLNDPDRQFTFDQLPGMSGKILVDHRDDDKGNTYSEVKSVAKL